jgi:fumarate reductase subunit D
VFAETLGIKKHIGMYSMPMPDFGRKIIGLPSSVSFVPDLYASLTPKMTMVERFKNIFTSIFMSNLMVLPLFKAIEGVAKELVDPNFDFVVGKFQP